MEAKAELKRIRHEMQKEIDSWDRFYIGNFDALLRDYVEIYHQHKLSEIRDKLISEKRFVARYAVLRVKGYTPAKLYELVFSEVKELLK